MLPLSMLAMSATQSASFQQGTGGNFTAAGLKTFLALIFCATLFMWVCWNLIAAYRQFCRQEIRSTDLSVRVVRSVVVMMVLFVLILV